MPTQSRPSPKRKTTTRFARGQVALERALSKLGLASRTEARALILAGRVKVNGQLRKQPTFAVNPEKAKIEIDGEKTDAARKRSFVLHKPKGVITTRSDEKDRPTVFTLPAVAKVLEENKPLTLHAVGRLDQATTGLLILTNDTRLSSFLTDPKNEVPRVYLVSVRGEVTPQIIKKIEMGVLDGGELLQADRATLRKVSGRESHLVLELKQGKNREIRRLLAAMGHEVTKLKRISYGKLELGTLGPGEIRELTETEIQDYSG